MSTQKLSFTLLELIVVIVIIGILAVISYPQFSKMKEDSLDQEAIANLKLIQAAEKIYRLETAFYYPYNSTTTVVNNINRYLRLAIPAAAARNWNYKVDASVAGSFTGKAQRIGGDSRVKCIDETNTDPYSCTW